MIFRRKKNEGAAAFHSERVCYLHIGPHKTGTTSIQNALLANEERLAGIGLSYPTPADPVTGKRRINHTPLSRNPNFVKHDDLKRAPFWKDLHARLETLTGSMILSTEHFAQTLRDPERYDRIVDFLHGHGFRIVVVAYVRDQPAWLNSWYTQDQRNFASLLNFQEFRDDAIERGLLDPNAYLKRPIEDERIEVRVVSFEQAVRTGLAKSFLDALGAPDSVKVAEPKAANPNIGIKGMYAAQELMRRVDVRIRSMPAYTELYEQFRRLMRARDWAATPYVGLTPEDIALLRARYGASNDAFAQEWFGTDWATACPGKPLTRLVFDWEEASEEDRRDVTEVVDEMVAAIQAKLVEMPRARRAAARRQKQAMRPQEPVDPARAARLAEKKRRAQERAKARRIAEASGED